MQSDEDIEQMADEIAKESPPIDPSTGQPAGAPSDDTAPPTDTSDNAAEDEALPKKKTGGPPVTTQTVQGKTGPFLRNMPNRGTKPKTIGAPPKPEDLQNNF